MDPLLDDDGGILTDGVDIEKKLFSTFFESKHISVGNFDDVFYETVNTMYENIKANNFEIENPSEIQQKLNEEITIKDLKWAIKNTECGGKSVDNHGMHPKMLHSFAHNTLKLLQKLFNCCLDKGDWVWNTAKVIFLKKDGKDSYAVPGAYRPISISSYIGKLLEKIFAARLTIFLEKHKIFDPNQEGFTVNRNTIRYLNRLHLEIKSDLLQNNTVIGLFVDFEKAFENVDVVLTPTAPSAAFAIGEKMDDPIAMYLNDIFTVPASMAGLPGSSVPAGLSEEGLPLGLQLIGRPFEEGLLLNTAKLLESAADFSTAPAWRAGSWV